MEPKLHPYIEETSFPRFAVDEIKKIGINGLQIKDFGSPGLSNLEAGSIMYEMNKQDGSIGMFFLVHNCLGMSVLDQLADEEQKKRLMPDLMALNKFISFGLTEPSNGSDASAL